MQILFTTDKVDYSKKIRQKPVVFGRFGHVKKVNLDLFVPEIREFLTPELEKYNYKAKKPVQYVMKRAFDYSAATFGIIATSPIMLAAAVAIKLESKGPVIFKQTRIGQYGKPFTVYKFRTMFVHEDNGEFKKIKDDPRVTRVGKFIRKFSIDELPQFFNVLKGDMSIVGPRPLSHRDHKALLDTNPKAVARCLVPSGAMLNYPRKKREISFDEKVATELPYMGNWNLVKDFQQFFSTFKHVITGNNI